MKAAQAEILLRSARSDRCLRLDYVSFRRHVDIYLVGNKLS